MCVTKIRRIAVIGAGPAGLASAKFLLAEKFFDKIDVFEQRNSVGGIWNYSPSSYKSKIPTTAPQLNPNEPPEEPIWHASGDSHSAREALFVSPIYRQLETNIPKELMAFSEKPFPADSQLFPKHPTVKQYLEEYAEEVKHLVQFEMQVLDLRPESSGADTWALTTKNLRAGTKKTDIYDAVVVSNGHYNVPYVPDIAGIKAWNEAYPGVISHSKLYDSPEDFRDKKVVVVGNSASGVDIGAQINKFSKGKLLLSSQSFESAFTGTTTDTEKIDCPEIVEFLPPAIHKRGIRFADGRIEEDVDAIVFCTGYLYSYPFLSSLQPPVVVDGSRTLNVYQQLFYIPNPTLVFPVLAQRIIPFPLSENQAAVFARVWSGRLSLPSRDEMKAWEDATIAEKGDGKAFHVLPFPQDADYLNFLYDWAAKAEKRPGLANNGNGKQGARWEEKERWMRERFADFRRAFVGKGEEKGNIKSLEELGFDYDQWK
ncbi:hypothetical protein MPDQ_008012 [Monascus purpureus]|uniref:Flavin dependent monooxygenase n=1 Tax=Monascus purpureus TaxID=5098 RepID=A0A507QUZ9_MONPU|nr:hypothetical protein MPDQ_008012 [Monascus purpureus]BDD58742.1 hypothetical protein MAP00_003998 [Monascus purpureus]